MSFYVLSEKQKIVFLFSGEVDCGFRPKADILVSRAEVDRYLDEKVEILLQSNQIV